MIYVGTIFGNEFFDVSGILWHFAPKTTIERQLLIRSRVWNAPIVWGVFRVPHFQWVGQ